MEKTQIKDIVSNIKNEENIVIPINIEIIIGLD